MSPIPNPRVLYSKVPTGVPVEGEHLVYDDSPTIDLDDVPLNGGFLTKTLVLSPEPYMRERMRDKSTASYSTTMTLGFPIVGMGVVVVVRSEDEKLKVGDHMVGYTPWEAYTVQPYERIEFKSEEWPPWTVNMDAAELRVVANPGNAIRWGTFCGALGTPGFTGYAGFEEFANAKAGETIFVSSAASGVGQMVVQLAKLRGLKVIGSAGSTKKVEFLRQLGVDVAFNYKEVKTEEVLRSHGPIDIYWDNVGGEVLECAIQHTAYLGRIILCGSISEYNLPFNERYGVKNMCEIWKRRLLVYGLFLGELYQKHNAKFLEEVVPLMVQGKIQALEHVTRGLENAAQAFISLLTEGGTLGKPVIIVAEE